MALQLNYTVHPASETDAGPPLLIAHGLFGSGRNFNSLGRKLADARRTALVDMRNHGDSPWDNSVTYEAMADDLAHVIAAIGGSAIVLGHSMGGKAAMALALTRPNLVAGLIVADIAPVAYAHTHLSFIQAMRAVDLDGIDRRSQVDPLLSGAIPEAPIRSFILQNLVVDEESVRWRLNLPALEAGMDDLTGWPAALDSRAYGGPCMFVRGGASDYVGDDGQARARMLFPSLDVETIDGAGHWLHAEKPDAFLATVKAFLAKL